MAGDAWPSREIVVGRGNPMGKEQEEEEVGKRERREKAVSREGKRGGDWQTRKIVVVADGRSDEDLASSKGKVRGMGSPSRVFDSES